MAVKKHHFFTIFLVFVLCNTKAQYQADEWEERDSWMDVSQIVDLADISKGSKVADVGCHEGYLSVRLSKEVGDQGIVYAVDVREDRLDTLSENLKERGLTNVEPILGDYDNPKLPLSLLDAVIVMDTYHEIEDYMTVLSHIKNALKPGGRILILEKLKAHAKDKSRDNQVDSHTLSAKYVKKELISAGFTITQQLADFGQWENDKNKKMWILVGVKPDH